MATSLRAEVERLLDEAGVRINGPEPWDMQIHNDKLFDRVMKEGSIGLGEAYMDGWWETGQLDEFSNRILRAELDRHFTGILAKVLKNVTSLFHNHQNSKKAYEVGERHYDVGNDLYQVMLDPRMVYTCGYWDGVDRLAEAQENKLDHVCRILDLQPGDRVLDIGCGWGSFAQFAAEKYEVEVVGITISKKQAELARERCQGMPIEIRLQDYREMDEKFDHIISLGMFEHVGPKNYRTYFQVVDRCLDEEGIFLLHTIGANHSNRRTDPWTEKYIFPNSRIPSIRHIGLAIEHFFVMEDWSNHGPDYDKTLMAWHQNFSKGWDRIKDQYSERFRRMWDYYLLMAAGGFRARKNNQWQIVLTKKGRQGRVGIPAL